MNELIVKRCLLAAAIGISAGLVLLLGALAASGFDFARFNTWAYQTNEYTPDGDFENISIRVEAARVTFLPSEDDVCRVKCVEQASIQHEVTVSDGTLTVRAVDNRRWYEYIGIFVQTPSVTVYLPHDTYKTLTATTTTGNIELPDRYRFESVSMTGTTANLYCHASVSQSIAMATTTGNITVDATETETVDVSATTGNISLDGVSCRRLTARSTTGRIRLEDVVAEECIQAETTTGGIRLTECDAGEMTLQTSTGSVTGTLLSGKTFVTDTATGRVQVPPSTDGGRCEITTSTGNIHIEIP